MRTIYKTLSLVKNDVLKYKQVELEKTFFIDIETTGFSYRFNEIYLIGCVYYEKDQFHLIQWLTEKKGDEYELLFTFVNFAKNYKSMIHFNGTSFDIPFITNRLKLYKIYNPLDDIDEIDVYRDLLPFKNYLPLEDLKLKTVEAFLGYNRIDKENGKSLINAFKMYLNTKDQFTQKCLLLHNEEDVLGLISCLKSYQWVEFFSKICERKYTTEILTSKLTEDIWTITLGIQTDIEINLQIKIDNWSISIQSNFIEFQVQLFQGELNYYPKNYRDYYYLPAENQIVHKNLAQFVDRSHRQKAKRENCFIKKRGIFIPLYFQPNVPINIFMHTYNGTPKYINLEDLQKDDSMIVRLCMEILSLI